MMSLSVAKSLLRYPKSTLVFLFLTLVSALIGVQMEPRFGFWQKSFLVCAYITMAVFLKLSVLIVVRIVIQKIYVAKGDGLYCAVLILLALASLVFAAPALTAL